MTTNVTTRKRNVIDLFTTAWATVEAYRHSDGDFTANLARLVDRVGVDEYGEAETSSRYMLTAELIAVTLRRVVALPASTFDLSASWKSRLTALHSAAAKPYFDDLDYDAKMPTCWPKSQRWAV